MQLKLHVQLFFIHQYIYTGVSCNSANLDFSPLVDSLLSNEERSFTPFPLMKRTLDRSFLLASLLPRRKRFPLVSTAIGRPDACVFFLVTYVCTHARMRVHAHARVGVHSRLACVWRGYDTAVPLHAGT